ncbi:hypothetical protein VKT23_019987 [Stygiomarasmius scandens]|uniref:Uncharacterized protein n=1 Tax=Marasmiellus scandens TaxID=2682957 RepID=A0ABR1INP0_9AGAR
MGGYAEINQKLYFYTSCLLSDPFSSSNFLSDQSHTIDTLFARVKEALSSYSQSKDTDYATRIWNAASQWQQCKSLLVLHHFVTSGLPELAQLLFSLYFEDSTFLSKTYPQLAQLVIAIVEQTMQHHAAYHTKHHRNAKDIQIHITGTVSDSEDTNPKNEKPKLLFPNQLHGLCPNQDFDGDISWEISTTRVPAKQEKFQSFIEDIFSDIVLHYVILPYLKRFNKGQINQSASQKENALLKEYLLRGAVLQAIVDVLDDESIFASNGISKILYTSHPSIGSLWDTDLGVPKIAACLRSDPDKHIQHICKWIVDNVSSDTIDRAHDLGFEVH